MSPTITCGLTDTTSCFVPLRAGREVQADSQNLQFLCMASAEGSSGSRSSLIASRPHALYDGFHSLDVSRPLQPRMQRVSKAQIAFEFPLCQGHGVQSLCPLAPARGKLLRAAQYSITMANWDHCLGFHVYTLRIGRFSAFSYPAVYRFLYFLIFFPYSL